MLTPVEYSQQVLKPIYEERPEQTKNVPGFVKELEVVKDTAKFNPRDNVQVEPLV
jgi:hypothetical protein